MKQRKINSHNNNLTVGLVILIIGLVLLLKKLGIFIPGLFSWPTLIIVIGIIVLVKHQFKSGFGYFMLLFGTYFLLKEEFNLPINFGPYFIPVGLILLGLYLMLFKKNNKYPQLNDWENTNKQINRDPFYTGNPGDKTRHAETSGQEQTKKGFQSFKDDSGDVLNSQAIFCGVQKRVLSKNFFGGKISTFFGGTEIDLSQADLGEHAYLDVDVAFGGVKLIVPPHWDLRIDVTNIFAGVEDKRIYPQVTPDPAKVLVIKGTVIFGGLEIKSF